MLRSALAVAVVALAAAPGVLAQGELDERYKEKLRKEQQMKEQAQPRREVQRRSASATFVECPVEKLRTEVVTELPDGWWQTPQVGGLEDTRVQTIGGQRTLVCAYRGYGGTVSVMREEPRGKRCRPRPDGFSCN